MSPPRAEPSHRAPAWLPPLIIVSLFAFQIYAFRWGVVMTDTLFQWGQALSGAYDDWHPPATTWLWRQLMRLGSGTAPILLFDCLLYWAGVWLIADPLRRRGATWAMAAAILAAATPIPFGQMGSILKDPLLAACCLAALGLAALSEGSHTTPFALSLSKGRPSSRRTGLRQAQPGRGLYPSITFRTLGGVIACMLLAFASATRFNAVFATAPLLVLWWPRPWLASSARALLALAMSAALLAGANLLIDRVLLRPHRSQPIYSLVNFDLAGIVAHGGGGAYPNLAAEDERRLVALCYDPAQFNPAYRTECDEVGDALASYAEEGGVDPMAIWRGAVARAPLAYLRHRLDHLNRNLRFAVPRVPEDAIYIGKTAANPYGLAFHGGRPATLIYRAARLMAWSPLGRPATWLAVAIGLLVLAPMLRSRALVMAAALSVLGYGGAYAVVSVAPDLRYNLWTMLAAMIGLAIAAADMPHAAVGRGRLIAATVPVLVTVAIELVALALG